MALKSKDLADVRPDVPVEAVTTGEQVRFNLILDKATHRAWKTAAIARDTTVADLVREAMAKHLHK